MPDPDLSLSSAYHYELPHDLIAATPAVPRDSSRLLVVGSDGTFAHRTFAEFPSLLRPGDVLVVNETRVIRARLHGTRVPGGGAAELLLLRPAHGARYDPDARRWLALVRPGRKLRAGTRVRLADAGEATVVAVREDGVREVELAFGGTLDALLARCGEMPLPPYVGPGDDARAERYQTVFARVPGSVAAPTASLHFTDKTFEDVRERGAVVAPIVLDVGLGTFKPMTAERLDEHVMHAEAYSIGAETAQAIADARRRGSRVVAAGTTVVRALESAARDDGAVAAGEFETELFITPGFTFRVVDALLTNFHLPSSTLLVLVSAFGGYEAIRRAYREALEKRYRFYSFGDAMFVERAAPKVG